MPDDGGNAKNAAGKDLKKKPIRVVMPDGVVHLNKKGYEKQLADLQFEMLKLEEWIRYKGLKVVVVMEGRDTAGKGGVIKRMTALLNPRAVRVVALPAPTPRQRTQWYFQRYVEHLPGAGELVIFDRSWYNRAGVEHVMGFCTDEEYEEFLRTVPWFENMLIGSGITLVKYWLSVSDEEQEKRFRARMKDPRKRWKLSATDLQSRAKWVDYSIAKDRMFERTHTLESPWHDVESDNKKNAQLNLIRHLLDLMEYKSVPREKVKMPPRQKKSYKRPPRDPSTFVEVKYQVDA